MNPNNLSSKENQAMRKRYGSWAASLFAVLVLLVGIQSVSALTPIKYYPTLSLRNWRINPDGIQRVPTPGPGGERYFLVPVYIYNEVDTTFNPNTNGQHLEPLRSFEFQMTYLTQAMVLDTTHGSPVVVVGPDPTAPPALAKTFFIRWSDQADPGGNPAIPGSGNPYQHRIRVSGAGSVPLPLAQYSDSGASAGENGILLWLRFKVIVSAVNAGLVQLDTARFNDHAGDPQLNPIDFQRGNFGGGGGVGGQANKGQGLVQITPQPAFEFRPFSQVSTQDNVNFDLTVDLIYDPATGGTVSRSIQVRDAVGNTDLTNINISSDQSWLNLSTAGPGGGQQTVFIPYIHYTSSFGSEEKNLFLNVANGDALAPGIYYGTVTFVSDGALNSPAKLRVRFIRLANPNEPGLPGQQATGRGVTLNISNSCNPVCTNPITFGTGNGATQGLDLIYGERSFTTDDRTAQDTNVNTGNRCYAYFQPLDLSADAAFQDPNFLGMTRDIRSDKADTTLLYKVVFSAGDVNCYPVKVCVDPQDFPEGGRIVLRFTLNGSEQGIDLRTATLDANSQRCVTINDRRINSFYIEYTPGSVGTVPTFIKNSWNLISLPVMPPNPDARVIFPNAAGTPYAYRADQGWEPPTAGQLEFGRGYMIKYGSFIGNDNFVSGVRTRQIRNVRVDQGWNTIGAASFPSSINGIFFTPLPSLSAVPHMQTDVWEYEPQTGYQKSNFLLPGKGYFVKIDTPGYYNLNADQSTQASSDFAGKIAERNNLENQLAEVNVSDARHNGQNLFFGQAVTTAQESAFEMPPTVHELDARFASNGGNVSFNKTSYTVNLRAQSYPLTMTFSKLQGEVEVRDNQGNLIGKASNGGSITVANPNVHSVEISLKGSNGNAGNVQSFSLEQNTPNPFFPVTSIRFSIANEMPVSLVVYNQLGQVVKTLASGVMSAGSHEVAFDGSDLAAGTYYYTLKAGTFVKTERMQLTK